MIHLKTSPHKILWEKLKKECKKVGIEVDPVLDESFEECIAPLEINQHLEKFIPKIQELFMSYGLLGVGSTSMLANMKGLTTVRLRWYMGEGLLAHLWDFMAIDCKLFTLPRDKNVDLVNRFYFGCGDNTSTRKSIASLKHGFVDENGDYQLLKEQLKTILNKD